jgi:sulfite exporter TauE/SafE
MIRETVLLGLTAAFVGALHTLLGPDHYVPFVAMSKAGRWSAAKLLRVTLLCGTGHLLSSALIGIVGILLGVAIHRIDIFDAWRGEIATWFLIAFGLIYFVWGVRQSLRSHSHPHHHSRTDDSFARNSPWVLFILLVLGPCEPLIPVLLFPAAKENWGAVACVFGTFSLATLLTMTAMVFAGSFGLRFLPSHHWERWAHPLTGATLCFTGILCRVFRL